VIEWVVRFDNGDKAIVEADSLNAGKRKACALTGHDLLQVTSVHRLGCNSRELIDFHEMVRVLCGV
jgi:hypothetical protein